MIEITTSSDSSPSLNNNLNEMAVITIAQPWATCIFEHGKDIANSSRPLRKRGSVAVYAPDDYHPHFFDICRAKYRLDLNWLNLPKGVILGFVEITDVVEPTYSEQSIWHQEGLYGYVLKNPIPLKRPIPAAPLAQGENGSGKFWELKGLPLTACLAQLTTAEIQELVKWKLPTC